MKPLETKGKPETPCLCSDKELPQLKHRQLAVRSALGQHFSKLRLPGWLSQLSSPFILGRVRLLLKFSILERVHLIINLDV